MPNLDLELKKNLSTFRRMSLGTWRTSRDPSVHGTAEVRMDKALGYISEFREKTGRRLTVTHMVARAVAEGLRIAPDVNAILRFSRIYLRKRIGIFMQVAMEGTVEGRPDLSGAVIYDVAEKSLLQIIDEVEAKVTAVRDRTDASEKSRNMFRYVPAPLMGTVLDLASFLSYTLNLDLTSLGIPNDPFGSIMITNIGSLGLEQAYVPLVPFSRVPMLLAMGAVIDKPVAVGKKVVVAKVMKLNATFDHRFIDGVHAAKLWRIVREWLESPHESFGPPA